MPLHLSFTYLNNIGELKVPDLSLIVSQPDKFGTNDLKWKIALHGQRFCISSSIRASQMSHLWLQLLPMFNCIRLRNHHAHSVVIYYFCLLHVTWFWLTKLQLLLWRLCKEENYERLLKVVESDQALLMLILRVVICAKVFSIYKFILFCKDGLALVKNSIIDSCWGDYDYDSTFWD